MSRKVHLILLVFVEFLGFGLGAVAGLVLFATQAVSSSFIVNAMLLGGCVLLGAVLARILRRQVVWCRCDAGRAQGNACGGRAYPEGTNPITYRCRRCGTVAATGVSDGDGGMRPGGRY